jgi:hypothetical protein
LLSRNVPVGPEPSSLAIATMMSAPCSTVLVPRWIDGFRQCSNLRGVFVRDEGDLIEAFGPPYGPAAQAVVDAAFASTA